MIHIFAFLSVLLLLANPARADSSFSDIPILYEGRVQPIESFAKNVLGQISGESSIENLNATEWLIEVLFDPKRAIERPLFKVENPDHLHRLGLSSKAQFVTVDQLMPLSAHADYVYQIELYAQLLRSLSMFLPLETSEHGLISYLDLQVIQPEHPSLRIIAEGSQINQVFKVIQITNGSYASPWSVINFGLGSPQTATSFQAWKDLIHAYKVQNKALWQDGVDRLAHSSWLFNLESFYNQIKPIEVLTGLYWGIFILLLIGFHLGRNSVLKFARALSVGVVVLHILVILSRVLIIGRPPIGTLYESVLFVAFIFAAAGFWFGRKAISLQMIASAFAAVLLLVSFYIKPSGDEFPLLEAVLNTNFWLATHVICITIGYGWCFMISGLAHVELWKKKSVVSMAQLQSLVIVALIFTIVGTLLGGLWADQSWGRFWGWDPKENGALFIVLWLVWLIHGKMSGHINHVYYLAGLSFLSVIVALSWFGVNLLSVGLHSYGFIEGIALGLFVFCFGELLVISGLIYREVRRRKHEA